MTVPKELSDKYDHLEFVWDANNEGLIYTKDGEVVHGLTGGGERNEWILPKEYKDGSEHIFYVEMACNGMFGNAPGGDSIQPPNPNKYFQLHTADIVAVNLEARALYFDFWEIGGTLCILSSSKVKLMMNRRRSRVPWRLVGIPPSTTDRQSHH
jgi:alpha-mannosidase